MSRTDLDAADGTVDRSTLLSGALFDEVLAPLAAARRAGGADPYFAPWRDVDAATYFVPSAVRRMSAADFEFPGGGTAEGLIDALAAHWAADGEPALSASAPQLRAIAEALREEAVDQDGSVDIFCYTLF